MQTTFACSLRWPSWGKSEHPTTNSQHPKTIVAIYHLSVKTVSRSAGRSSTAAAAYRAGVEITDERTGEIHDYRRKAGVESAELFLPAGAPEWATDRAKLWNAAEQSETRKNSTVAREFEVALPAELSADQRRELAHDFTKALVKKYGFAADCAIHLPGKNGDSQNHHAHILCSTRKLTAEGFTAKTRELDDRASGAVEVVECRELFADMTNAALERAGHSARVDHRSLEAQGIDRDAGIHLGPSATAIERRGEVSVKTQHHQERQQEAAGKVAAMVAIAEAQAKAAAAEIKEKENDPIRAAAFERIGKNVGDAGRASEATNRAGAFALADHGGIAQEHRAIEIANSGVGQAIRISRFGRNFRTAFAALNARFKQTVGAVATTINQITKVVVSKLAAKPKNDYVREWAELQKEIEKNRVAAREVERDRNIAIPAEASAKARAQMKTRYEQQEQAEQRERELIANAAAFEWRAPLRQAAAKKELVTTKAHLSALEVELQRLGEIAFRPSTEEVERRQAEVGAKAMELGAKEVILRPIVEPIHAAEEAGKAAKKAREAFEKEWAGVDRANAEQIKGGRVLAVHEQTAIFLVRGRGEWLQVRHDYAPGERVPQVHEPEKQHSKSRDNDLSR